MRPVGRIPERMRRGKGRAASEGPGWVAPVMTVHPDRGAARLPGPANHGACPWECPFGPLQMWVKVRWAQPID